MKNVTKILAGTSILGLSIAVFGPIGTILFGIPIFMVTFLYQSLKWAFEGIFHLHKTIRKKSNKHEEVRDVS